MEHASADPEVTRRLEANRVRLESTLRTALLRAQREGRLSSKVDPTATAALLLVLVTGLKAMDRAGVDQQRRLDTAVESALGLLAV